MAPERPQLTDLRTAEGYPSARAAWLTVGVLYCAYVLAFIDRQILAFLVEPIRADFAISDFQFSLLSGAAFVIFYGLLGIPIGVLADRGSRRNVIALGVGFWSLMTALCGRATGFGTLFLARLGVGVGQAALVPAAVSMLSDSFPPEQRGIAISTNAAGIHGGIGLANIFGGTVVAATAAVTGFSLPVIGTIAPWQFALLVVALPGLVVAALVMLIREPKRHTRASSQSTVTLKDTIAFMHANWFVFVSLIVGASLSAIGSYGLYAWVPAMFMRAFGWSSGPIGVVFGLLTIVLGTSGLVISGSYAGQFIRRGSDIVYQRLMMLSVACAIVPGAISMTADSAIVMWICVGGIVFFLGMPIGLAQAGLAAITPNKMRAQVIAIYLAVLNLIGLGLGPAAVAGVTDFIFSDDAAVDRSIGIVVVASSVLSVLLLSLGVKQYEEMGRRAE